MSLLTYIAHTGKCLSADPEDFERYSNLGRSIIAGTSAYRLAV